MEAVTTLQLYTMPLEKDRQVLTELGLFSDEYVFDVFTFPILKGIGKEALQDPNAIILSESLAKKYFGDEDPIGKTLVTQNERLLTVKGIIDDVPKNQHFSFDFISSFRNLPFYEENRWNSNNFITYIVLPQGHDHKKFEEKLLSLDKYLSESYSGVPFKPRFFLQPLQDIHLQYLSFIASPIAFWTMNKWLQDFAYKIKIEWWMFVLSGLAAVSVALLTISIQSIKAASMNPVKSLRSE